MTVSPALPCFSLPGDFEAWMNALDVGSCEPVFHAQTGHDPASVAFVRKSDPDEEILRVWAVQMADGLHFYVNADPSGFTKMKMAHLAIRRRPVKEAKMSATAGIIVAFALIHTIANMSGGDPPLHRDWEKKAHARVLKALEKGGAGVLGENIAPEFLELVKMAMRLVDMAMGKDVRDAVDRVRKEFSFLLDHLDEEAVVRLWREALVDKTHDR